MMLLIMSLSLIENIHYYYYYYLRVPHQPRGPVPGLEEAPLQHPGLTVLGSSSILITTKIEM